MKPLESYRQSILAGFEVCARRTYHSLITPDDLPVGYVGSTGDLGTVAHAVFAEILRTLRKHGESQMSTQEAVEVMREVQARADVVLPADEREDLKMLTLRFCEYEWPPNRILAIEQRLATEVKGQDGKPRILTGQPDLLLAHPPATVIICDYKTGWGRAKEPRQKPSEGEVVVGKQYLSERGHFQLDIYGLLSLRAYPAAQEVILRELHLRSGQIREARLHRDELEHVEREVGIQMQLLERAISEGDGSKLWRPRPGHQCLRQCPVARSCPIPAEQRGVGAIESQEDADDQAARYQVVDAVRQQLREGLKAYHEATGHEPAIGDGKVLRWHETTSGGQSFGVADPSNGDGSEPGLEDAFRAAAEAAQS